MPGTRVVAVAFAELGLVGLAAEGDGDLQSRDPVASARASGGDVLVG